MSLLDSMGSHVMSLKSKLLEKTLRKFSVAAFASSTTNFLAWIRSNTLVAEKILYPSLKVNQEERPYPVSSPENQMNVA